MELLPAQRRSTKSCPGFSTSANRLTTARAGGLSALSSAAVGAKSDRTTAAKARITFRIGPPGTASGRRSLSGTTIAANLGERPVANSIKDWCCRVKPAPSSKGEPAQPAPTTKGSTGHKVRAVREGVSADGWRGERHASPCPAHPGLHREGSGDGQRRTGRDRPRSEIAGGHWCPGPSTPAPDPLVLGHYGLRDRLVDRRERGPPVSGHLE